MQQSLTEAPRDRRTSASPRVPVDLLVELATLESDDAEGPSDRVLDSWNDVPDAPDGYDADALDLSATGLRLRSAILPDVGQRLRCRFDLPETDARCEVEGEVVWSSDAGSQGEFGLRFTTLSPGVEDALTRWVMEHGPTTLPGTASSPGKMPVARVKLDGVATALEAEVVVRDGTRLDVEQALPFFELGRLATVETDGRSERRRLEHVALRIEDGIPRLVLGLGTDVGSAPGSVTTPGETGATEVQAADSTLEGCSLDELGVRASESPSKNRTPEPVETGASSAPSQQADATEARGPRASPFEPVESTAEEDPRALARRRRKLDEVRRVLLDGQPLPDEDVATATSSGVLATWAQRAREDWLPALRRWISVVRGIVAVIAGRLGPRARVALSAIAERLGTVSRAPRALLAGHLTRLRARFGRAASPAKRRTTAPPPTATAREPLRRTSRAPSREQVASEPGQGRTRLPLRFVLAGVLALGAVGTLSYALGAREAEPAPIELPAALSAPMPGTPVPGAPVPAPVPGESRVAPPEEPNRVATPQGSETTALSARIERAAERAEPLEPTSLSGRAPALEPTSSLAPARTDEGRLPMPGYPTISRVGATSEPPQTSPSSTVASSRTFGAARVDGGQTTTLRMSVAPTGLEGQADASGFTVTIRGALSLDRAAPIARSSPAVDRASILNRGDHAVLDVRFVEGRSPAYRVVLRGDLLDVTIGR